MTAGALLAALRSSLGLIRERLAKRNAHLPANNFFIDPEVLDGFVELFQIPSDREGASVVVIDQEDS